MGMAVSFIHCRASARNLNEAMLWYTLRQLLYLPPTLFGVSLVVFFVLRLIPGVAQLLAGMEASQTDVEKIHEELGLTDSLWVQYGRFLGDAASGDLGRSFRTRRPVTQEILARLPQQSNWQPPVSSFRSRRSAEWHRLQYAPVHPC